MFLVQKSMARKSPGIFFYAWPEEYKAYFKEKYLDTQKSSSSTITKSADDLTLTVTTMWESEEAFNEFIADPFIAEHMALRNEYNLKNEITGRIPTKTEI